MQFNNEGCSPITNEQKELLFEVLSLTENKIDGMIDAWVEKRRMKRMIQLLVINGMIWTRRRK